MSDSNDDFFAGRSLAKSKAERLARAAQAQGQAQGQFGNTSKNATAPAPAQSSLPPEADGRMVDIGAKPTVAREAIAEGFLRLQSATLQAIVEGRAPKGDPFGPARIAGILAAKMTPQLIPFCHPIPLTAIEVVLSREAEGVRARATVRTNGQTGVEMEALAAVSGALLTVWDMTKALEKDATGNYPSTAIEAIRVVSKTKGSP